MSSNVVEWNQKKRGMFIPRFILVPKEGLEPSRILGSLDFESSASTSSATSVVRHKSMCFRRKKQFF